MQQFRLFLLFLLLVLLNTSFALKTKNKEEIKPYLSQNYIDTMIQDAFYNFVEASDVAGGNTQYKAIEHAKKIAELLKGYAKTDPNRSYIIFRVNELEFQINLEEEEIRLKHEYERQKAINVLVQVFNTEVGKWRPEFMSLYVIQDRMSELDGVKADELYDITKRRVQNISREISYNMEIASNNRDFTKFKKEFEYIRENRKFLTITSQKYGSFEDKIFAITNADSLSQNINLFISDISKYIKQYNLKEASRRVEDLQYKLKKSQSYISFSLHSSCEEKLTVVSKEINRIEDSLVAENLTLVKDGRVESAIDYMERVLRKFGVSNDKIQRVDKEIIGLPSQKKYTKADTRAEKDFAAVENTNQGTTRFDMENIKARAQQKADSIRQSYDQEESAYAHSALSDAQEVGVSKPEMNQPDFSVNKKKAEYYSEKIYDLLEKQEGDKAYKKFRELYPPLVKYLDKSTFTKLEKTVQTAYNTFLEQNKSSMELSSASNVEQKKMEEYVLALISEIYTLIDKNDVGTAYQSFKKNQRVLKEYACKDAYDVLRNTVEQSFESVKQ